MAFWAFLAIGPAIFSSDEAVCDGEPMQRGQICGINAYLGRGDSYQQKVEDTRNTRVLAHAGLIVATVGFVPIAATAAVRHFRR